MSPYCTCARNNINNGGNIPYNSPFGLAFVISFFHVFYFYFISGPLPAPARRRCRCHVRGPRRGCGCCRCGCSCRCGLPSVASAPSRGGFCCCRRWCGCCGCRRCCCRFAGRRCQGSGLSSRRLWWLQMVGGDPNWPVAADGFSRFRLGVRRSPRVADGGGAARLPKRSLCF